MVIEVMNSSDTCDAELEISFQGEAYAEDYVCILGNACGHCFSGAGLSGELTIKVSEHVPWIRSFNTSIQPPKSISECPEVPEDAPLDTLWPEGVLAELYRFWGDPVFEVAMNDGDEVVRKGVVELLRQQGQEGVPLLIKALQDRDKDVRLKAVFALGSLQT